MHDLRRRAATPADTEFARAVHHRAYRDVIERQFGSWDEALQDGFFEREWAASSFEIVELDGEACGYVCIEERDHDVHVRELVLDPPHHGRGIGTQLLREVTDRATERGVPVHLGTFLENRARALYRRLGFVEFDRTETQVLLRWTPPAGRG